MSTTHEALRKYENKKIGILGFGQENIALVRYLLKHGIKNITICDREKKDDLDGIRDIKAQISDWRLGPDYLENLENFDLIFRTPGLPYLDPKIQAALAKGVEVSNQIKLFFKICPSPIIGITGTKGKGTTSTLIFQILSESIASGYPTRSGHTNQPSLELRSGHRHSLGDIPSAPRIFLAGNIGRAPIEFIDELTRDDIVVLELSSFQLQDLEISPHIAVVLNIASDHLDVHATHEEYVEAKTNIVRYQTEKDYAVINADYLTSFEFASLSSGETFWFSRRKSIDQGAWVKDKKEFILRTDEADQIICQTREITLRGEHNWENICAAITASYLAGADANTIGEVVRKFPGLEHRLEFVGNFNGVGYYNDSFATTPETTIAAVNAFSEPIHLIAGGSEKYADYTELGQAIAKSNVRSLIAIGVTGPRIAEAARAAGFGGKIIEECENIQQVMEVAKEESRPGEVVLLSPASASFDWFANYKERGNQFKQLAQGQK